MAQLPVASIAARPSVLFLWSTSPQLEAAIHVLRAWGFHYRGVAWVWVRTTKSGAIIHGQGVRPSATKHTTEFVLCGATRPRGRPLPVLDEGMGQVVLAPRPGPAGGRHSAKPPEILSRG